MELCRAAFAFVICLFIPAEGQTQSCSAACSQWCGNEGLIFPGSNGRIVNVAFGKRASVSSGFSDTNGPSAPACIVVNGRTSTTYMTTTQPNTNCIMTGFGDHDASWSVDLGRNYTVSNIAIYRRKATPRRMSGIHVEVDNQTCYTFPRADDNVTALDDLPEKIDVTCTPPLTGRVVRLQKHEAGSKQYYGVFFINICEVQVWGCPDELYGDDCVERCGQCADNDTCSAVSGHCPHGCQPGWQGDDCKQLCDAGKYGNDCNSSCGHCNTGDVCHHINGTCPRGCEAGFDPSDPFCKKICQNGRYGENCSEPCGNCRENEPCNPVNGACVSCQPQFKLPFCKVCTGNRYGASCELNCSTKCGGDGSCEQDSGRCVARCVAGYRPGESGFCNEVCEDGKYGEGCSLACGKCSRSCRHDDGLCIGGCLDGYEGPYCAQTSSEDSPNLAGPLAGAVFGGLCVIALSIFAWLLIRRSRKRSSSETANPPDAPADQNFEAGAQAGINGQVSLQEVESAGVTEAEESHIYDGLQTPDDSDRDPYSTPVFKGKQNNVNKPHTYQNSALHSSDTGKDYYNL